MTERDLGKQPLSAEELRELIGKQDYRVFLNTRNELFRTMNMKIAPPAFEEALKLMAQEPNLIKRPIVQIGKRLYLGFDEKQWKDF
ncbi:MAG: hypothetical protein LAO31_19515 [Acidobacteriia bacterium]|nr:hypothetical protein [Terriglobia bacterium]